MSKSILILLLLIWSKAFPQDATIDDIEAYLYENKTSIFFEFYVSEQNCASLHQRPCTASPNCTSISEEKSERLIDILSKQGLLNYHHSFFEKEKNSEEFKDKQSESEMKIRICFESKGEPLWVFPIGKENSKMLVESINAEIHPLPCSLN